MTGHLLSEDTLALLRRSYFNMAQVAERQTKDKRPYPELDRAYAAAVEALGKALEHIEAVEEQDASDVSYAGLRYVDKRDRWHKKRRKDVEGYSVEEDEAAFAEMCDAQTDLIDAATMYAAGFEDAK